MLGSALLATIQFSFSFFLLCQQTFIQSETSTNFKQVQPRAADRGQFTTELTMRVMIDDLPQTDPEIRLALINVRAAHHDLNLAMPCLATMRVVVLYSSWKLTGYSNRDLLFKAVKGMAARH